MVFSKESFSSLNLIGGPSIQMGYDTHIQSEGKGTIQSEHVMLKNVMYVTYLATNLLYVYNMTHIGSAKRVVFGPDIVDISYISTRNIIAKGATNHASKEYDFSHFFP